MGGNFVQKYFKLEDFMIPEQAGFPEPWLEKKCCGRCKEKKVVRISDARRVEKMKTGKK